MLKLSVEKLKLFSQLNIDGWKLFLQQMVLNYVVASNRLNL